MSSFRGAVQTTPFQPLAPDMFEYRACYLRKKFIYNCDPDPKALLRHAKSLEEACTKARSLTFDGIRLSKPLELQGGSKSIVDCTHTNPTLRAITQGAVFPHLNPLVSVADSWRELPVEPDNTRVATGEIKVLPSDVDNSPDAIIAPHLEGAN